MGRDFQKGNHHLWGSDPYLRSDVSLEWFHRCLIWNPMIQVDKYWLVVWNIFYFHPYLGEWSDLTNIFQMGWNHQPEYVRNGLNQLMVNIGGLGPGGLGFGSGYPSVTIPFIFGDPRDPNRRAPNHQLTISWWLVVSTHLRNISQIGSFPKDPGRNKRSLKPPPSNYGY